MVQVFPPGEAVTVYPVSGLPPLLTGATHLTTADPFPAMADTPDGAPGTVAAALGTTGADAAEAGPVPTAFRARTVNE